MLVSAFCPVGHGLVSGAISRVLPAQAWLSSKMVSPVTWVVTAGCSALGLLPGSQARLGHLQTGCWMLELVREPLLPL